MGNQPLGARGSSSDQPRGVQKTTGVESSADSRVDLPAGLNDGGASVDHQRPRYEENL